MFVLGRLGMLSSDSSGKRISIFKIPIWNESSSKKYIFIAWNWIIILWDKENNADDADQSISQTRTKKNYEFISQNFDKIS